jgi:thymidylate kinase
VLDNARGKLRRWWMKQVPCIAIDGSDGVGKTTLIRSMLLALPVLRRAGDVSPLMHPRQQHQGIHIPRGPESSILHERGISDATHETMTPIVAKKLYRRSWIYQIVHSALRRLTGRDRCAVDDQLAAFTTVRAAMRLWCSFAWTLIRDRFARRRTLLLDRSVGSFLIRNRKGQPLSMAPMWSFISRFVPSMTTVLLTVPWSVLKARKQEMSRSSHEAYQSRIWLMATRHRPFDVIVFDNTLRSDSAADCLLTMLGLATASPDAGGQDSREAVGREPSDVAAPDGLRYSASVNCESSSPEQEGRQPSQPEVAA